VHRNHQFCYTSKAQINLESAIRDTAEYKVPTCDLDNNYRTPIPAEAILQQLSQSSEPTRVPFFYNRIEQIQITSYNKIVAFLQCPLRYYYRYVAGLSYKPSVKSRQGVAAHLNQRKPPRTTQATGLDKKFRKIRISKIISTRLRIRERERMSGRKSLPPLHPIPSKNLSFSIREVRFSIEIPLDNGRFAHFVGEWDAFTTQRKIATLIEDKTSLDVKAWNKEKLNYLGLQLLFYGGSFGLLQKTYKMQIPLRVVAERIKSKEDGGIGIKERKLELDSSDTQEMAEATLLIISDVMQAMMQGPYTATPGIECLGCPYKFTCPSAEKPTPK